MSKNEGRKGRRLGPYRTRSVQSDRRPPAKSIDGKTPGAPLVATTPPWHACDRGIGWEVHVGKTRFCEGEGKDGDPVWCVTVNEGWRETFKEADAHLISAAPDLYAALEKAAIALSADTSESSLCQQIRAALAKARGEKEPR